MYTLDLARAHIRDLQRDAARRVGRHRRDPGRRTAAPSGEPQALRALTPAHPTDPPCSRHRLDSVEPPR